MSRIERRPIPVYGLGSGSALPNFLSGLACGAACLSLLVFVSLERPPSRFRRPADVRRSGSRLWCDLDHWTSSFWASSRSISTADMFSSPSAAALPASMGGSSRRVTIMRSASGRPQSSLSILFGLGHLRNPGESPIGSLCAGLFGVAMCLSLWRTGSLWWAVGFHASWDWAESFVFGVADSGLMIEHHLLATHPLGNPLMSGGATGPEGSLFALPILAITALIIIFTFPRAHPVYPQSDPPGGSSEMPSTIGGPPARS